MSWSRKSLCRRTVVSEKIIALKLSTARPHDLTVIHQGVQDQYIVSSLAFNVVKTGVASQRRVIHIDTSIHFKVKYEAFKKTRKETFELPPTYWPEDIFTLLT